MRAATRHRLLLQATARSDEAMAILAPPGLPGAHFQAQKTAVPLTWSKTGRRDCESWLTVLSVMLIAIIAVTEQVRVHHTQLIEHLTVMTRREALLGRRGHGIELFEIIAAS